ncbi:MAG: APC family permease, partial [Terriglobales bacterium]
FTNIVAVAEKAGKPVSLLVVPGKDVFQSIIVTAQRLQSSTIVVGYSAKLSSEEQAKLTGDAWEGLPDPRPRLTLEVLQPDGSVQVYYLGPHTPRLRPEDLELLHNLWLEVTADQANRNLHHYDVVALALHELQDDLHSGRREAVIERLRALAQQQLPVTPEVDTKAPAAK